MDTTVHTYKMARLHVHANLVVNHVILYDGVDSVVIVICKLGCGDGVDACTSEIEKEEDLLYII